MRSEPLTTSTAFNQPPLEGGLSASNDRSYPSATSSVIITPNVKPSRTVSVFRLTSRKKNTSPAPTVYSVRLGGNSAFKRGFTPWGPLRAKIQSA